MVAELVMLDGGSIVADEVVTIAAIWRNIVVSISTSFKRHVRRFTSELDRNVAFEFLEALLTTLPLWWAVTLKLPQVTSPGLTPLEPPNVQG